MDYDKWSSSHHAYQQSYLLAFILIHHHASQPSCSSSNRIPRFSSCYPIISVLFVTLKLFSLYFSFIFIQTSIFINFISFVLKKVLKDLPIFVSTAVHRHLLQYTDKILYSAIIIICTRLPWSCIFCTRGLYKYWKFQPVMGFQKHAVPTFLELGEPSKKTAYFMTSGKKGGGLIFYPPSPVYVISILLHKYG